MRVLIYDDIFALVARLESIRVLLAIACHISFKVFQMGVKSEFLNDIFHEKAYVEQPKELEDLHFLDYVYKLNKALYGLKQAPIA